MNILSDGNGLVMHRNSKQSNRSGKPRLFLLWIKNGHIVNRKMKVDFTPEEIAEFVNDSMRIFAKPQIETIPDYLL